MERLSWNEYFMEMANIACKRSTCMRRQVGAVIVKDNQILSTGYNGSPKNTKHCSELPDGCMRTNLGIPSGERHELCRGLHAEQNAIIQCAVSGASTKGATIYVNTMPCSICLKMIINAGIETIVAESAYPDELTETLLAETNIKLVMLRQDS